MSDIYTLHFEGLIQVHRAIEAALQAVVGAEGAPPGRLVADARGAAGFLMLHHDAEDTALFPGLRRHGRLRSTDAGFLDARDREHRELHALCDHLLATAGRPSPDVAALARQAGETLALLRAHVREEELGLAPERLREMVTVAGLEAIGRDIEAFRARVQGAAAAGAAATR